MIVSHQWLQQFVPHKESAQEVGELLSRHCVTLDGIEPVGADLTPFVVGQVVEAGRHPNSDRLWVTKVDDGSGELLDVVCGAPNVVVGTKYPFARTGTRMPAGIVIEKRKIRGETSNGMLCSARELGLGEEHDGILALETDAAPGTPLLDVIPVADVRLDLDVLPNRPDLLSHRGVAREVAAILGVPMQNVPGDDIGELVTDVPVLSGDNEASGSLASVRVESRSDCAQYVGIIIDGVQVGPSPAWLVQRIESVGGRSISNVVDATNYVLHAFGQPVHAFDLDRLAGHRIVVRETREGESLVTLDGVSRALAGGTTVICDAEKPVGLAGIMGGQDSEVTTATTRILLEVASFDPRFVRRVRRTLGINTDASYRFERGTDAGDVRNIALAAATLIARLANGTVREVLHVGGPASRPSAVALRPSRLALLLGGAIPTPHIVQRLESLGCEVRAAGDTLEVIPPTWRHDLALEVDLIEEVARLEGFDNLPNDVQAFRPGTAPDHPLHVRARAVRDALVALGFAEVRPMPFTSKGDEHTPRVRNPLAEDEPYLRASLLDTLASRVSYNFSRMQGNVRLFEVGNAFLPSGRRLPAEEYRAAAVLTGARRPAHFTEPRPPAFDIWDAKAVAERVAHAAFPDGNVRLEADANGTGWLVFADDRAVGSVQSVHVDAPEWASPVYGVELVLGVLSSDDVAPAFGHAPQQPAHRAPSPWANVRYQPLPTTPAAEFDLALVVPESIAASTVEAALRRAAGDLLERVDLFDEYRGAGVDSSARSLAWRLTLRHPERTLRDKEIDGRRSAILAQLQKELGIRARAT